MKRFLLKLSALLFLILLSVFIGNYLYIRTNWWKGENNINKFDDIPYNLSLGNVGSSHGNFGIKYDAVPEVNAWNFALDSQPYFYDHAVLERYIDHFAENATVLILVSYFEITKLPDYSVYRSRYYRILPKEKLDSWRLKEYIFYNQIPFLSAGFNRIRIFRDVSLEQTSPYYNREKFLTETKLQKYCIEKHKSWTAQGTEKSPQEGYEQNIESVSAIIELCHAHHLCPVLITTPVTDVLNEIYAQDDGFFDTFYKFTSDLCEKYSGIRYFDYSHDKRFSQNHDFFADGDHLNNFGAEKFTRVLVDELKASGLLQS